MENIDKTKIRKFLRSLNKVEYCDLKLHLQLLDGFQDLIRKHKLTNVQFCELFNIKLKDFEAYIKGDWEYDLTDFAKLSAAFISLELELIKEQAPQVKFDNLDNLEI